MANSWGTSWGTSWGNSWGTDVVVQYVVLPVTFFTGVFEIPITMDSEDITFDSDFYTMDRI